MEDHFTFNHMMTTYEVNFKVNVDYEIFNYVNYIFPLVLKKVKNI